MFQFTPSSTALAELAAESPTSPQLQGDLTRLLEALLNASFETYEGQPALATMLLELNSVAAIGETDDGPSSDIEFRIPREVSPENIRALAPGISDHNVVIVRGSGTELRIVGLGETRPGVLLSAISPGRIVVRVGSKVGLFDWRRSDVFPDLASSLTEMIEHGAHFEDTRKSFDWAQTVALLLTRVRRLGRGGAVLMVPSSADLSHALGSPPFELSRPSARFLAAANSGYDTYRAMRAVAKHEYFARERGESPDWNVVWETAEIKQRAALEAEAGLDGLSKLTAIDGAVVLNYSFELLMFGAKIKSMTVPKKVVLIDFVTRDRRDSAIETIGGTRHQSALRFVSEIPGSVAFVVSQDGSVSVATRESQDAVALWRRIEVALLTTTARRHYPLL